MATRITQERKVDSQGGGSTTTTTTKTYETRSYETEGPSYRPGIQARNLIIQRSSYGGPVQKSVQQSYSYGAMMPSPAPGAYANISALGTANIKTNRAQEKKDMRDLNERFASYIERVRFLEAQNRKLADELDKLKAKWGKETTAIKAMYQAELDEARRLLDDAEKEKARLQIRVSTLENEIEEFRQRLDDAKADLGAAREKIDSQNETLSTYESEINLLRRRVESLESERDKDKKEIARLQDLLNKARTDLDNETLAHIDAENRRQTLEEELEFLKQVHDQEMKELAALAYRDTTNENREFWKSELANAIREIQSTYDEKLDSMRGELETYYNMKVQEFRTGAAKNNMETVHAKEETKRLRSQLGDLRAKLSELEARNNALERELADLRREYETKIQELEVERNEYQDEAAKRTAELEAVLKELQDLMDSKLGLELEIAAYRKLLEGEENNIGLKQVVEMITSGGGSASGGAYSSSSGGQEYYDQDDSNLKVSQVVKGEMSAKTTYQRSAKGPVSISECSADGKFIVLENNGRRDESLGGWFIKRVVDGVEKANVELDRGFSIRPNGKVKIWAGKRGANAGATDVEVNIATWGLGANIITKLVNTSGEDRATHVTKTVYTS